MGEYFGNSVLNVGKPTLKALDRDSQTLITLFVGKGTCRKWDAFRRIVVRIQDMYGPVRVKEKAGRSRIITETESLIKSRHRQV